MDADEKGGQNLQSSQVILTFLSGVDAKRVAAWNQNLRRCARAVMDAAINHKAGLDGGRCGKSAWAKQVFPGLDGRKKRRLKGCGKRFSTRLVTEDPSRMGASARKLHERQHGSTKEQFRDFIIRRP